MPRITLKDSMDSAIKKIGQGNPGALRICFDILLDAAVIDPDAADPFLHILALDSHGIYAERVWMLYKDVCHEELTLFLAVLRAVQLGFLNESAINRAIDNYGEGLELNEILKTVQNRLPRFGRNPRPGKSAAKEDVCNLNVTEAAADSQHSAKSEPGIPTQDMPKSCADQKESA